MPPTFFIFVFVLVYLPLGALVSLTALVMHFLEKYKQYSMPVVAVYVAVPAVLALVTVVVLPVILLMIGIVYVVESYWAGTVLTSLRITMAFVVAAFYILLSLFCVVKVCPLVWRWVLRRWPNGFSIAAVSTDRKV